MKLSKIQIVTSFEVRCPQHPDDDAVYDDYREAQAHRRDHHRLLHADDPPEPAEPRARGRCSYCEDDFRLRSDGTIYGHDITLKRPSRSGRFTRDGKYKAQCPGARRSPKEGT